jgi:hypothetical protein
LLNELTPELREQFEEHFFSCQQCANDLQAGAAFLDHSKAVLSSAVTSKADGLAPQRSGKSWAVFKPAFAGPVLALLLIVVGYQAFVAMPKLKLQASLASQPHLLPALSLINVTSRGNNTAMLAARRGEPFLLFVDIPSENRFSSYIASLYDAAGHEIWSLNIPESATKDTVSIQVPGQAEGKYVLVVRGTDGGKAAEVGRFPFELQIRP